MPESKPKIRRILMKFMKKVKFVHRLLDQTLAGWPAGTFVIMKLSARTIYKSFQRLAGTGAPSGL